MSFPRVHTISTSGSAGSASGSQDGKVAGGKLVAVEVERKSAAAATLDVTITNSGRTVLTLSNLAADALVQPRVQAVDAAGSAIAGSAVPPVLNGAYTVAVAQANAGSCVVRLYFDD